MLCMRGGQNMNLFLGCCVFCGLDSMTGPCRRGTEMNVYGIWKEKPKAQIRFYSLCLFYLVIQEGSLTKNVIGLTSL